MITSGMSRGCHTRARSSRAIEQRRIGEEQRVAGDERADLPAALRVGQPRAVLPGEEHVPASGRELGLAEVALVVVEAALATFLAHDDRFADLDLGGEVVVHDLLRARVRSPRGT